jgi:hypothetical protein
MNSGMEYLGTFVFMVHVVGEGTQIPAVDRDRPGESRPFKSHWEGERLDCGLIARLPRPCLLPRTERIVTVTVTVTMKLENASKDKNESRGDGRWEAGIASTLLSCHVQIFAPVKAAMPSQLDECCSGPSHHIGQP